MQLCYACSTDLTYDPCAFSNHGAALHAAALQVLSNCGIHQQQPSRGCGLGTWVGMNVQVPVREAERQGVFDGRDWPVHVRLTNGKVYGADLVISAIGVQPNTRWLPPDIALDEEAGGILVDRWLTFLTSGIPSGC